MEKTTIKKKIKHLRVRDLPTMRDALYFLGSKVSLVDRKKQLDISSRVKLKFISQDSHSEMDELLGYVNRDGILLTSILCVDDKPVHVSFYHKMLNKIGMGESTLGTLKNMSLREKAHFILKKTYFSLTPSYRREKIYSDLEEFVIFDSLNVEERERILSLAEESKKELTDSLEEKGKTR